MQMPAGVAEDLLQARVGVDDRLLAVPCAPRSWGCTASGPAGRARTSAIRSSNSVGLTSRSASRIPDDSNWKTPVASPLREHLVGRRVVERDLRDVEAADQLDRLVDHVEVAQAEEVHLQQAEPLDVAHRELGDDLLVGALLLQRHDVDQRLGADHDAGGVDRVRARQPLERHARGRRSPCATGSESTALRSSAPGLRHSSSVWPGPSGISFAIRSTTP